MKSSKMKRLSIITFVLTLVLTGGLFAYWADSVLGSNADTATAISIGEGQTLSTTVNLDEVSKTQGKLVPAGFAVKNDEVEEILIVFDVNLEPNEAGASGAEANLVVSVLDTGHALLVAEILPYQTIIVSGGPKTTITIKITLTEPADKDEYDEVANQSFDIKVQFEALI